METPAVGAQTITRYGLGARGVDFMERTVGTAVTKGFPIYDAHGNMMGTLYRNGSTYAVGNLRRYSAWGSVRGGSPTGDPKGRYCAALGHRTDDESGLTYMRARYYDPDSGRFLSQDPARAGNNWFRYANNSPVNLADENGTSAGIGIYLFDKLTSIQSKVNKLIKNMGVCAESFIVGAAGITFIIGWFAEFRSDMSKLDGSLVMGASQFTAGLLGKFLDAAADAADVGMKGPGAVDAKTKAKAVGETYATTLGLFFALDSLAGELGF